MRVEGSGTEGVERPNGLVSGFEVQALLNLVVKELGVGHQVLVALDSTIADGADNFEAVVETVAASNNIQSAGKQTVPQSF